MKRIFAILVGLVLTIGGVAQARPLNLDRVKTNVDMTHYDADTIVVSPKERRLFYKTAQGDVVAFSVGVGRAGFEWSGAATVAKVRHWPEWIPPAEMRAREPGLPVRTAGGINNPLGARALYLYQGDKDTLYRIHGTNERWSIGEAMSSGCVRLLNEDIIYLSGLVRPGTTKVVVLK